AFDGIERKIGERLNTRLIGFNASIDNEKIDRNNLLQYITPRDLRSYGLIPEIIGRLPVLTYLDPLNRETLRNILTEPKNAIIKQYIKLLKMDGVDLTFDPEVLDLVVDKAIEFKLGARGLRSICELIMTDIMYETPSRKKKALRITLEFAQKQLNKTEIQRISAA
ncbi:MAG: ATP-dependent Clp protease ATP-binding subunit ClpX, partial [Bacteroidales bacterium]|nr:ATP-dependent Clp protease ATP-binding subunit ClpX [Bacteroidales bacterium]